MRIQLIATVNRLRRFDARLRSIDIRHREGAIQGNNRRVIELQQLIVRRESLANRLIVRGRLIFFATC
jgi:hypothetical protein